MEEEAGAAQAPDAADDQRAKKRKLEAPADANGGAAADRAGKPTDRIDLSGGIGHAVELSLTAKAQLKTQLTAMYRAYCALDRHHGSRALSKAEQRKADEAFQCILAAARGPSAPQRLAALLIPKFAATCPSLWNAAAQAQLHLWQEASASASVDASSGACVDVLVDAWTGLVHLVEAAAACNPAAVNQGSGCAVTQVVCQSLLRHLGQFMCTSEQPSTPHGNLDMAAKAMLRIFEVDPRGVLACAMNSVTGEAAARSGAVWLLSDALLRKADTFAGDSVQKVLFLEQVLHHSPGLVRWLTAKAQEAEFAGKTESSLLEPLLNRLSSFTDLSSPVHPPVSGMAVKQEQKESPVKPPSPRRSPPTLHIDVKRERYSGDAEQPSHSPFTTKAVKVEGDAAPAAAAVAKPEPVTASPGPRRRDSDLSEATVGAERVPTAATPRDEKEQQASNVLYATKHVTITSLGSAVTKELLVAELKQHAATAEIVNLKLELKSATVTAATVQDAARIRQALHGALRWGHELQVKFTDSSGNALSTITDPYLWVGDISSHSLKEAVLAEVSATGLTVQSVIIFVFANAILLEFASLADTVTALNLLCTEREARSAAADNPRSSRSRSRSVKPELRTSSSRHLWVGGVGPDVREDDLIEAFAQHGPINSSRFLRSAACAFFDFRHSEDAAAAKAKLHGKRFGQLTISVEFKGPRGVNSIPTLLTPGSQAIANARGPASAGRAALGDSGQGSPDAAEQTATDATRRQGGMSRQNSSYFAGQSQSGWDVEVRKLPASNSFTAASDQTPAMLAQSLRGSSSGSRFQRLAQENAARLNTGGARQLSRVYSSVSPAPSTPAAQTADGQATSDGDQLWHSPHDGAEPDESVPMDYEQLGVAPAPVPEEQPSQPPEPSVPPIPTSPPPPLPVLVPDVGTKWQGSLSKSGVHLCKVTAVLEQANGCEPSFTSSEGWPQALDVLMRADLQHVLTTILRSAPPGEKCLWRLVSDAGTDNHKQFVKFMEYLAQRGRAGVVKLEVNGATRTMYLMPAASGTCFALDVAREPRESLLALIVPYVPPKPV
eukprot:jgi/Chlat1/8417/Chrsp80S07842